MNLRMLNLWKTDSTNCIYTSHLCFCHTTVAVVAGFDADALDLIVDDYIDDDLQGAPWDSESCALLVCR